MLRLKGPEMLQYVNASPLTAYAKLQPGAESSPNTVWSWLGNVDHLRIVIDNIFKEMNHADIKHNKCIDFLVFAEQVSLVQ